MCVMRSWVAGLVMVFAGAVQAQGQAPFSLSDGQIVRNDPAYYMGPRISLEDSQVCNGIMIDGQAVDLKFVSARIMQMQQFLGVDADGDCNEQTEARINEELESGKLVYHRD